MKKIILLLMAFTLCFLLACSQGGAVKLDGNYLVITVDISRVSPGATLEEYMQMLSRAGDMQYEMENGMLMSVDGVTGGTGEYWMLYTDDPDYGVRNWGSCEYEGVVYDSASVGATTLVVKDGYTYIWNLQRI